MKEQLISGSEDMTWLRDVHLPALPSKYKSALIIGNEDWPNRIVVYESANPRYDDPGVTYTPDENGKFTHVHANPIAREIDASAAEKRWAAEAMRMGRFLALHQIEKNNGKRMSREKARSFFEKFHGFPHWAADIAAISYEDTWRHAGGRQMNPMRKVDRDFPIGTRVITTMGVRQAGVVVPSFYWKESTDGTYRAPDHAEHERKEAVWVKWDNGTKGWISAAHLTRVPHFAGENPLSFEGMKENPLGETLLALVGVATLATIGWFWYKSSQPPTGPAGQSVPYFTIVNGIQNVSASGASSILMELSSPTTSNWVSIVPGNVVAGSTAPLAISGPFPTTVQITWVDESTGANNITTLNVSA